MYTVLSTWLTVSALPVRYLIYHSKFAPHFYFREVGPIVGGQLYDHIKKDGWTIICIFIAGMLVASLPLVLWWSGNLPLWRRLRNQLAYPGPTPQPSSTPQVAS